MNITCNLEKLLGDKNLSLYDVAKNTDISYQQLWKIKEKKTKQITFKTLNELCNFFKCTPNELLVSV